MAYNPETRKLYIVVREDILAPGQVAAQAVHAAFQFATEHPDSTKSWMRESNHICVLGARSAAEFQQVCLLATATQIEWSVFAEYDADCHNGEDAMQITAVALEANEAASAIVARLPLALRPPKKKKRRFYPGLDSK